mgnify:CR=1 FL=1
MSWLTDTLLATGALIALVLVLRRPVARHGGVEAGGGFQCVGHGDEPESRGLLFADHRTAVPGHGLEVLCG